MIAPRPRRRPARPRVGGRLRPRPAARLPSRAGAAAAGRRARRRAGPHRPRAAHRAHPPGAGPAPAAARRSSWSRARPAGVAPGGREVRRCRSGGGGARRRRAAAVVAGARVGGPRRARPVAPGSAGEPAPARGRRRRRSAAAVRTGGRDRPAGGRRPTLDEWRAVVDGLYRAPGRGVRHRRPRRCSTTSTPPGSALLAADAELVTALARRGGGAARLRARRSQRGRRPPRPTATGSPRPGRPLAGLRGGGRRAGPTAPALRRRPGRGRARVRMVLVRSGDGLAHRERRAAAVTGRVSSAAEGRPQRRRPGRRG